MTPNFWHCTATFSGLQIVWTRLLPNFLRKYPFEMSFVPFESWHRGLSNDNSFQTDTFGQSYGPIESTRCDETRKPFPKMHGICGRRSGDLQFWKTHSFWKLNCHFLKNSHFPNHELPFVSHGAERDGKSVRDRQISASYVEKHHSLPHTPLYRRSVPTVCTDCRHRSSVETLKPLPNTYILEVLKNHIGKTSEK